MRAYVFSKYFISVNVGASPLWVGQLGTNRCVGLFATSLCDRFSREILSLLSKEAICIAACDASSAGKFL